MKSKIICLLVILVILGAIIFAWQFMKNNQKNNSSATQLAVDGESAETASLNADTDSSFGETPDLADAQQKDLILYFSATGNTRQIAEYIQEITAGDLVEILPQETYTSADLNYTNDDCRSNQERLSDARPAIANQIVIDNYETIYLGYPIWWGEAPKIILTLLDSYDFSGKTIIPFCTSGSSGIAQSVTTLQNYADQSNWQNGIRFSNSATKDNVQKWLDELNAETNLEN